MTDQWRHLADALVLGPYMVFTATQVKHPYFRAGLIAVGLGTVLYGGYRFLRDREAERGETLAQVVALARQPGDPDCGGKRRRRRRTVEGELIPVSSQPAMRNLT